MVDWKNVAGDRNRLSPPNGVVERKLGKLGEDEQGLIRSVGSNPSVLAWSDLAGKN